MRSIIIFVFVSFCGLPLFAQQSDPKLPVIVQPGSPGQPSKILPASTKAKLPPPSPKDAEFMQGMIMHHGQAVEMTAMIAVRTKNKEVIRIGAKISQSQSDEIKMMKRWLEKRGEKTTMPMMMSDMNMSDPDHGNHSLMPGMLTDNQMEALRTSTGAEFDRLFLEGMIRHHGGALVMVKDLFETAGAGQDAEIFNFASDVDTGQRAEIKIMQNMLGRKTKKEKR
jgi:uncharacterized protein (DUF305 family)